MESIGGACVGVEWENKSDYDLRCQLENLEFTLEVKLDKMASVTGNIAIEFYNPYKGADSGLGATKADIWAHLVYLNKELTVWFCSTDNLKKWIELNKPNKLITVGGDKNSSMYLYSRDYILEEVFVRVDDLVGEELLETIRRLL